jgi:hypothetical protein
VAIKIMKLTNTLISALFCYFHLLRWIYPPQHFALKHTQSIFLPFMRQTKFHTQKKQQEKLSKSEVTCYVS